MNSNDKLARTRALRSIALSHFKLIEESSKNVDDEEHKNKFKVSFRKLKKVTKDFEKHHNMLITLIANEADELITENKIFDDFTRRCDEVETIYFELFELPTEEQSETTLPSASNSTLMHSNDVCCLPKLKLKTFSGDMTEFPAFHQMFMSSVHVNRSISNVEKFNYLISVLSGAALELIDDIPVTSANYQSAYNLLLERYNNKREQAFTHWSRIEACQALRTEDATSLRNLIFTFKKNISVLRIMGLETDKWDFILSYMLLNRLDSHTRKCFEQKHASNAIPKYDDIQSFLEKQCIALESAAETSSKLLNLPKNNNKCITSSSSCKRNSFNSAQNKSAFLVQSHKQYKCFLCSDDHIIFHCPIFKSKGPKQRFDIAKQNKACINRLATSHNTLQCSSTGRCKVCKKSHHTLLHFENKLNTDLNQNSNSPDPSGSRANNEEIPQLSRVGMLLNSNYEVLLSTAMLKIKDNFDQWLTVRAVLDCGAQSSFISRSLANKLGLKKSKISMSLQGLGEMYSSSQSGVSCTISSLTQPEYCCTLEFIIIDKIGDELPSTSFSKYEMPFTDHLKLADPDFNKKSRIDLLLGNDIFPYILKEGKVSLGENKPVYLNTVFGWIVMGKVPQISAKCDTIKVNSFFTKVSNPTLDNILQKFWTLEEVPDIKVISSEDRFCENYFIKTTTRYPDGKYVVSLPFKSTNLDFGNTREIALRRFLSLEKRLSQDKKLCLSYSNVLSDYLQKGHLIKVPPPPVTELTDYFYIPHHAVIKHESSTTPLRVVFDASSHSANKPSLNDTLYRILWRFSPSEPIADYQLNTVTFGVASSPYLAIRTLHQLANDYLEYPLASEVLKHSIYIDDILDGHNSLKICSTMKNEIIELLRKGGFEARKWASNSPELLHDLPESYKQNIDVCLDLENNITKILGLRWNPIKDLFFYSITADQDKICTKRNILSELARIFDPLSFLTPVTFFAKLIIQRLWSMGLGWDDRPPIDVSNKWEMFKAELPKLREIQIPRQIITFGGKAYELVGFCDSSLKGYCGVVYVRTTFTNPEAKTYLVCSKSKVAPLKPVTIPRLELCAAVLLAKLMEFLLDTFKDKIRFENIFAFTDSSVALQWIKGSPHCWQTFVSNRVSFIQERLAPSLWYISSELNPADGGSRGTMVAIKNDNANPLDWLMGRVTELTLGTDGVPRVAIVKTTKGLIKRPLVKLCPLPDYDDYF
ncbi:uncharacterized protein [Leptinotarsa decemlineata]|uniref:uncharacterized protein n=1 Tax=Leptinotarsa decemlineata TaxID=7539 RepID=UPI003D3099BE